MKALMAFLVMLGLILPLTSYAQDRIYLDKHGRYQGFSRDDGDSVRFFDRQNMPDGWYDRNTNTIFDRRNNPVGNVYDFGDDD